MIKKIKVVNETRNEGFYKTILTNLAYPAVDFLIPVENATLSPSITQSNGGLFRKNVSNLFTSAGLVF